MKKSVKLSFSILALLLAGALVAAVLLDWVPADSPTAEETAIEVPYPETAALLAQVAGQEETDEMLLAELASGYYTPDDPLVVVNPYDISPLTALILFQTEDACRVSIHIPGADAQTSLDYTFDGYTTDHIIPVYGLYADTENQVTLTLTPKNGAAATVTVPVETEALTSRYDFLHIITSMEQPDEYEAGFNISYESVLFLGGIAAFDADGVPRWHLAIPDASFYVQNYHYHNHYLIGVDYGKKQRYLLECDPLGRIYQITATYDSSFHHDVTVYTDHTVLIPHNSINQPTIEDTIVELDLSTGEVTHVMDLRDVLQSTRGISNASNDVFHLNAIVAIDGSTDILLSLRAQSYLVRMSWPDGEIRWIAGSDENSLPMFDKYYLTPTGEDYEPFYRQHAPCILSSSDVANGIFDILLFDNGWTRDQYDSTVTEDTLYSRMVEFRIDETAGTITQIRQYGQEFGRALYAYVQGDANELINGNWLGAFDVTVGTDTIPYAPAYVEVDANNDLVWMMQITAFSNIEGDVSFEEYRVERSILYSDASNDLQLGISPVVFLSDMVREALGYNGDGINEE
ncbi:MAG TPA: aryl-sulfate sulfotransferase [Candidatus Limiplasma sp.]|nr:aryl-sulfate sulfotransferase [Candidatus Limiplasma sp.]